MLFSERYGYKKVQMLKKDEMPDSLRNRIWNFFYQAIFRDVENDQFKLYHRLEHNFTRVLWDSFFKGNLCDFDRANSYGKVQFIKNAFFKLPWNEIYDFIDFFYEHYDLAVYESKSLASLNDIFKQEKAPYCIINCQVVPLMSDEEVAEIEKALNVPDKYKYKSVSDHLSKALELFSRRPEPDYKNSIKESISAVESLVQIVLGENGTLGKLIDRLNIHPAMKEGFKRLYGWTSDNSGIRHGEYGESFPCEEAEARYMLITCSAFVNYAIMKLEK